MFHLNHYPAEAEGDADADMAGAADPDSSTRPFKLPRRDISGFRGASASERHQPRSRSHGNVIETALGEGEAYAPTVARSRGVTACERCRSRKTRCDNRHPSCGYCTKLGVQCLYESESSFP